MNIFKKLFYKPKYLITYEVREKRTSPIISITLIINQDLESWFIQAEKTYHSVTLKLIKKL